jgi:RNA polymerase sigma-70 factor (ECF subfamily)
MPIIEEEQAVAQHDSATTELNASRLPRCGDEVDFERIYRQYSRRVYSLCLRMVGNTAQAEDLTQEAFLQAFRKIDSYRGESAFYSWLYRLTVNVVLMRLRRKSFQEMSLSEDPGDGVRIPAKAFRVHDTTLAGVIDRVSLQRAIVQLPAGSRAVFVLHDVEGYEHNEIAEMLRLSVGTSKSQLHKARRRLRSLLLQVRTEEVRNKRSPAFDQSTQHGFLGGRGPLNLPLSLPAH